MIATIDLSPATTFDEILSFGGPWTDRCPLCDSRAVMPTLLARGQWSCWDCEQTFEVQA